VASLGEFFDLLEHAYPEPAQCGVAFEPFVRDALLASPSHQFVEAWLWKDWPDRDGPEHGIDIVAVDENGSLWGVQCKYTSLPDKKLTWNEDKISNWVGSLGAPRWDYGLLVSNCSEGVDAHVEYEFLHNPKLKLLIGEDLESLKVSWPDSLTEKAGRAKPIDPYPHQLAAIEAVCDRFDAGAKRLQIHMACGTGKTFTALWIYQYLQPDLTMVMVPSLSLMAQTIREWTANTDLAFRYLPVCSDSQVTEGSAAIDEDPDFMLGE
jgi:predicted helicase